MKEKKKFIQIVGNFKTLSHYVYSLKKIIHKDGDEGDEVTWLSCDDARDLAFVFMEFPSKGL